MSPAFFFSIHILSSEEVQQSKGEESETSGGEGSYGRRVRQSRRSQ